MKGRTAPDSLPEAPVTLSMFDPIRIGRDPSTGMMRVHEGQPADYRPLPPR